MPLARPSYVSRRLRKTIARWVADVTGLSSDASGSIPRVVWAEQNLPRPELPYVALRGLAGTSEVATSAIVADMPTLVSVQVTTTTPGEAAKIALNHGAPSYVVQGGDADTNVRDGLISAILDGADAVVATPTASDTFTLAGLAPGLMHPVSAVEGCTVSTVDTSDVELRQASRTSTVRVETFGFDVPDERARDYTDALIADIGRGATLAFFAARGVSIVGNRPTPTDISGISGAERETRSFFDLQVSQWTRHGDDQPAVLVSIDTPPALAGQSGPAPVGISLQRPTVS